MSRFGLLFALLSLLFVSSFATSFDDESRNLTISARPAAGLGAGYKSATWKRVTANADWEPRAGGVVEFYTGRLYTGRGYTNAPAGSGWLLMYGAGAWTCYNDCAAKGEVWYSANKGARWTQMEPQSPFSNLMSAQTVQDSQGHQYRIQGTDEQHGCDNGQAYSDVYQSTDGGYRWTQKNDFPAYGTRFLGTAVVDSADNIYVIMGQDCNEALNDVWVSRDHATSWRAVPQRGRLPPPRAVHGSVVGKYQDPSTKASVDAIYVMYGWRGGNEQGNLYRNDIWVSTNGASNWVMITEKAQWTARGDSQLEITNKGVLVLAGGVSNIEGTERRQLNDVWASLDGGFTWGACSDNAQWDDRVFQYTAIDNEGYLYVMGGLATDAYGETQLVNDVWVSGQSFDDAAAVADMCGLIVPPCGVGLKCLPTDTGFVQGNWGVSCDACKWSPLASTSASSSSMTMTYLFVAFLLATIALAAALAYLVYRMKQSGAGAPIPLPASAQRWWNDKPAGGLTDELNKGNTASDTMYNPLTIRDQM